MSIEKDLLSWFLLNKRDLPWRKKRTPYKIWVSEIMLQQTQVATVIPYYERFLNAFPNLESLANADINKLMKIWEGLGYYTRVKNMQEAAKTILQKHNGVFPSKKTELLQLKGIGDYTAAIIASIAFKEHCAAVDGNVLRVISRLNAINAPIQLNTTKQTIRIVAQELLSLEHPGEFNEAMMEVGALICKPKNPTCDICPISLHCQAYKKGLEHKLPVKLKRAEIPHYHIAAGVIYKDDFVLIALRPANGLLGNLWEFPGGKQQQGESLEDCCKREIFEETGLHVNVLEKLISVKHAYTHFKITLHAYRCNYISGSPEPRASQALKWVRIEDLTSYAFPKANKKIIEKLQLAQFPTTLTLF
ncbi:A/G-specific adenine glycosylase [Chloroherpeton thalassium ATCC 35110]|uniref:Adenine DNA glycosylase n=1 Tax=Chloroherpeton thalassium (strain ATCC 35110 / GB-78) TaxID=517418 RepID=B3QVZ4_CHLT3|nr:A/G-specific adenine glycosylase [Chloroherpeton thalassium]ACF14648.1 A/G-specific adenine glycosylase [Chloroherpeton thalassium ATCC 35110]